MKILDDILHAHVMHDHFKTYQNLLLCKHAECNAHIDRYLKSGIDFDKNEDCKQLLEFMHEMLHRKHTLIDERKSLMEDDVIKEFEKRYEGIINSRLEKYNKANPNIEKRYEEEYIKTFRRMLEFKEDHERCQSICIDNKYYTNSQHKKRERIRKVR